MIDWFVTHGVWFMGGGVVTVAASALKLFPALWKLVVNSGSAPHWKGVAKGNEALLEMKTDDYDELLTEHQELNQTHRELRQEHRRLKSAYDELSESYRALQKSTPAPAPSRDGSAASPDSGASDPKTTPS